MISMSLSQVIKRQQRVATVVWCAMVASVVFYWMVLYVLKQGGMLETLAQEHVASDAIRWLEFGALPFTLLCAVLSLGFGRLVLSAARVRNVLSRETTAQQLATSPKGQLNEALFKLYGALESEELSYSALLPMYVTSMMIRLAFADAIIIYGFVLTLMTGDLSRIISFAVVSLVLMFVAFPKMTSFIERQQQERQFDRVLQT